MAKTEPKAEQGKQPGNGTGQAPEGEKLQAGTPTEQGKRRVKVPVLVPDQPDTSPPARVRAEATDGYLEGQLLIAMPAMADPRFQRSVILLCHHNADGAMGLVINKRLAQYSYAELLNQLDIASPGGEQDRPIYFGGPVESGRGFVLHSDDYTREETLRIRSGIALTATTEILRAISEGQGPRQTMFALGYAGWGPGQLEAEIGDNAWLHTQADAALVFDGDLDGKWERAMSRLGVTPNRLSQAHGHA